MDVLDRMLASMRAAWMPVGEWEERDGVGSILTPAVPQRSIVNAVVYERGADVQAAYDWLERRYAEADAWTVWVPEADRATAAFLEQKGHELDAQPAVMACDLASYEPPVPALPAWQRGTIEDVARINEAAYPWRDGSMERALLGSRFGDNLHIYVTEGASTLGILDHDGDASVIFVATLPEARGRGLAGGLLAAALVEARERGNDISTLQATKLGEPVYARLGYERLGRIEMWEKRRA
jgi:ribosomal protein S18 acetylase RimI-like enzyme